MSAPDASPLPRWRWRPFPEGVPDARSCIAVALSRRADHSEIPPGIWADAGAIVKALRADGFTIRRVKP